MSLHPILALDHVIEEYRDYLRMEFRAKDPGLKQALERELDRPLFLAQEPFFQAHRPFMPGRNWKELPLDPRLANVMAERSRKPFAHLHQSEAIEELLRPNSRPVVVTTGTGSGKTEAFLLPVIQNAFEDSVRFTEPGLTAILVYPMNALANDQALRIEEYLEKAGMSGAITVEKYDRGTPQAKREEMRKRPPHILLTNYMMLEYLLVRPADREGIFANHRCRFLVLDEVHTYRGTLGSNIALLVRRVRAHLGKAQQVWGTDVPAADRGKRFPALVPVGTSATIKSIEESAGGPEEARRRRDTAVQEFFGKLTGAETAGIRVFGEELEEIQPPRGAGYPARVQVPESFLASDPQAVQHAMAALAGQPKATGLGDSVGKCRLLWDLHQWLLKKPMSVGQIVRRVQEEVPGRKGTSEEDIRREVSAALVLGAALPEGTPGSLQLRAHRLIRGGWQFHRCVNPECGRLFPMGEERCACGFATAPLYLCRNCGADYLRFDGDWEHEPLRPASKGAISNEWMLCEPRKFGSAVQSDDDDLDDEDSPKPVPKGHSRAMPTQIKGREVVSGSIDPGSLAFSRSETDYRVKCTLAPARTRCLCCGAMAGSRSVITPVSLGTSAAVKVVAEGLVEALADANRDREGHDGKERLLVFSDSRQDAAHQARFIVFASRYDRMRRRVVRLLKDHGPLRLQRLVELLGDKAVKEHDNPHLPGGDWVSRERLELVRAWEEAPVLDDISVTAGYRSTMLNIGLVGVRYDGLDEYVTVRGEGLARELGLTQAQLEYVSRCILDDMRAQASLSRPMLRYHPMNPACPDFVRAAEWERRVKQPQGYAAGGDGKVAPSMDRHEVPFGIKVRNAWRAHGGRGRGPGLERMLKALVEAFGGPEPTEDSMKHLLEFLQQGGLLAIEPLFGAKEKYRLAQVNAEVVQLFLVEEKQRIRCGVCSAPRPGAVTGLPCPRCGGRLQAWRGADFEANRSVRQALAAEVVRLEAKEHTAQVPHAIRADIEEKFKGSPEFSGVNLLACSPTLEMGIDVGGLDAVETLRPGAILAFRGVPEALRDRAPAGCRWYTINDPSWMKQGMSGVSRVSRTAFFSGVSKAEARWAWAARSRKGGSCRSSFPRGIPRQGFSRTWLRTRASRKSEEGMLRYRFRVPAVRSWSCIRFDTNRSMSSRWMSASCLPRKAGRTTELRNSSSRRMVFGLFFPRHAMGRSLRKSSK